MSYILTEAQWEQFVRDMAGPVEVDPQWIEVARQMEEYRQAIKARDALLGAGPTMEQVLRRFAEFVWDLRAEADDAIRGDRELLRIARAARERITLGGTSNGYCAAVCVPLAAYLERRGVPATDVHGAVGEWQHAWIALADGRILDPTADQFNRQVSRRMPPIYLGPRPAHYEA